MKNRGLNLFTLKLNVISNGQAEKLEAVECWGSVFLSLLSCSVYFYSRKCRREGEPRKPGRDWLGSSLRSVSLRRQWWEDKKEHETVIRGLSPHGQPTGPLHETQGRGGYRYLSNLRGWSCSQCSTLPTFKQLFMDYYIWNHEFFNAHFSREFPPILDGWGSTFCWNHNFMSFLCSLCQVE